MYAVYYLHLIAVLCRLHRLRRFLFSRQAEEQGKVGGEKGGQDVFHFNSENLQFHM